MVFCIFAVTLTIAIQSFQKTLQLMMYCQTKFGFKRISSSEDIIQTVVF